MVIGPTPSEDVGGSHMLPQGAEGVVFVQRVQAALVRNYEQLEDKTQVFRMLLGRRYDRLFSAGRDHVCTRSDSHGWRQRLTIRRYPVRSVPPSYLASHISCIFHASIRVTTSRQYMWLSLRSTGSRMPTACPTQTLELVERYAYIADGQMHHARSRRGHLCCNTDRLLAV
jgi:hypothetical protein